MPGGEGSPINLLDHRASTTSGECANSDEDERTTDNVSSTMTTVLAGDGLRRRKVIHAAKETFDKASRLLRRKIPCTGHLMTPRRLWIQKVPTQECDVVVMFPSGTSDETLMWLLGRLRAGTPGLVVHVRHHASSDSYGFYLTAPFSVLLKAAEEVHLPKALRQEFGGGLKEFVGSESSCFEGSDDETRFFTTQERQSLVLHLLHTLRAGPQDLHSLSGLKMVEGQAIIPKCISAGIISQVFPLHELPALEKLQRTWVRAFLSPQPLDDICKYFGVKITMYFAWLGHYTTALIVPAAVGAIYWIGIIGRNQAVEDVAYVLFSVFNVIWATVYLETWKRRGAELAYRWGTLDQRDDLLVEPRPLFTGTLETSPVTGRLEPTYPRWKRNMFRYFVSVPIIAACLFFVFIVMILSFQIQDWWDARLESRGYGFWLSYVPKVLLAVVIALMDEAYFKVAIWLNDMENYRLDTEYENHLIYKVALFQFVNSFLSLFYIAFYLQDQERLKEQLAALLIARQVIGNLKESAVPYLIEQLRLARLSFELFGALSPSEARPPPGEESEESQKEVDEKGERSDGGKSKQPRNVSQAELESSLYRVGHPTNSLLSDVTFKVSSKKYDGAFSEHLEMLSQLGYVCLFSSAFPLAAMAALLGNLLELRGDAFKLCFVLQRPFGRRVSNIGTWQNAMEAMGLVAILVNCALIGLSGQVQRMFPEMSATQTILLIVALEHIMLGIRFIIICAIPDIPHWVATEMAKVEFLRREAVRRLSSTPSPEQHPATVIADGESEEQQLLSNRTGDATSSSLPDTPTLASSTQTPSSPPTPSAASVPRIAETPSVVQTPGSASSSEFATHFPTENSMGSVRDIHNSPRCSIPGGERGRRSREWLQNESEASGGTDHYSHHLTIGPHGGVDWVRRLGLEAGGRKSSDSEISGAGTVGTGDELTLHRSTDCIVSKELASSSDSDLLRSAPPWTVAHRNQKFRFSPEREREREREKTEKQQYQHHQREIQDHKQQLSYYAEKEKDSGLSDSSKTISSQEEEKPSKEEREAKKTRVKQSLMKRARSVAIFSLKLKERRAREAEKAKEAEREARWQQPQSCVGGELSCIPIEKLISVDDIAAMELRRLNH
ncbi:anoctamin-8 isoform X3 [Apis laboriosa]|uniref:anoctamin-8 isoform X3 n=1 Tax=Apis laboriosa TaxID=183418 RepID=UPI001CC7FE58|nr:anoctamin-8 isoform X3 [Apis laboriosa]